MIKRYQAEVYVVGIYCNKCGSKLTDYKIVHPNRDIFNIRYGYTCKNCGHKQVEDCPPTYQVVGNAPEKVEVENNV